MESIAAAAAERAGMRPKTLGRLTSVNGIRRRVRSKTAVAVLAGAAAVILAGCGSSGGTTSSQPAPSGGASSAQPSSETSPSTQAGGGMSTRTQNAILAIKTAAQHVSGGKPYDLETEHYQGNEVWDIKVASDHHRPYELYVSSNGQKVVHHSRHDSDSDTKRAIQARVSFSNALKTAAQRAHGRLSEAEIDDGNGGKTVWTATFQGSGGEHEVIISAETGKVIRVKTG